MKKKEINQVILTTISLILTVIIVSGGTFAYFSWRSGTNTMINVTFNEEEGGIKLIIDPQNTEKSNMYPTKGLNSSGQQNLTSHEAVLVSTAVITIINNTGVSARPWFKLKAKIENRNGTIQAAATGLFRYVNYAVTDNGSCDNPIVSGKFGETGNPSMIGSYVESDWITKDEKNSIGAPFPDGFPDITSENSKSVSFEVPPYTEKTKLYQVCVWIDSSYTFTNNGTDITDPLQNATISVTWSESSYVQQVAS